MRGMHRNSRETTDDCKMVSRENCSVEEVAATQVGEDRELVTAEVQKKQCGRPCNRNLERCEAVIMQKGSLYVSTLS